jgi:hypothetical protein
MLELITYSEKKSEGRWQATIKVEGDQKSVAAMAKMLSALTYIVRVHVKEEEHEKT